MLRPQDSSTRERKSLNNLWQFRMDPEGEGRSARWFSRSLPDSRQMAVPASYNDIAADAAVRDYFGDVWYQTTVWVPLAGTAGAIVLHFESATHRATVWVNDTEAVSHEGGYTPFEADITDHVSPVKQVRITALVNNTLHLGRPSRRASSKTPRPANGSATGTTSSTTPASTGPSGCTPPIPLTSTTSRSPPTSTATTGIDRLHGRGGRADDVESRVILRDADGTRGHGRTGPSGTLTCAGRAPVGSRRRLPLRPGGSLVDGGPVVDSYHQSVGVRTVEVDGIRFLINGEPFYFTGFGKHEDSR